jgi:hypothetical protein
MNRKPPRSGMLALAAVAALLSSAPASASHAPPGTKLWGYQANGPPNARIFQYDIGTDTFETECLPTPSGNGRAIAFDPADGRLWYAFIGPADGLIHKTTPPPACVPAGQIPFGEGPGPPTQDDIGALDVDPDDGHLWAAGYTPDAGRQILYKVNKSSGAILAACWVPKAAFDPGGNDTLAVTRHIGGLPQGKYLVTDAGEFSTLDPLLVVDAASAAPYTLPATAPRCDVVAMFDPPVGVTGVDFEDPPVNDLIGTDLNFIYDFGNAPYATITAAMPALPGTSLEDIAIGSVPPASTPGCEVTITEGGHITALNGDRATFGGNASVDLSGSARGEEEYQDHGPARPLDFHSTKILSLVCSDDGKEAEIFGEGNVDGSGPFVFRIRVRDEAEPGAGADVYGILIGNGYASGDQTLEGGNVQIHRLG